MAMLALPAEFELGNHQTWPVWFLAAFIGVIFLGLQILSFIVPVLFGSATPIPIKGKHLDEFSSLDKTFIFMNKCFTCLFVYHVIVVTPQMPTISWRREEITWLNTLGSLVVFYVFYDFFYTLFHRALHIRSVYPWIHKHHHRQKAPSRGTTAVLGLATVKYDFVSVVLICGVCRQFGCHQCSPV